MLQFNSSGLLVPNTNIPSTLQELNAEFVVKIPSPQRLSLNGQYLNYSTQLKSLCGGIDFVQWIDGSFVTKTPDPSDMDIVTFLDFNLVAKLGVALKPFIYPQSESTFHMDAYIVTIYPEKNPKSFYYASDSAYWMGKFDKTRRNRRGNRYAKGFLQIIY